MDLVSNEEVILIDRDDRMIGMMDKLQAHQAGELHRAFSVFIFNSGHKLLLQQRAITKYHSAGLWTNTCCSHPRAGEVTLQAAHRRLQEEMGLACDLTYMFNFIYRVRLPGGLIEHEYDHGFFGVTDKTAVPSASEVMNFKYIGIDELENDLEARPEQYSEWLKICFDRVKKSFKEYFSI